MIKTLFYSNYETARTVIPHISIGVVIIVKYAVWVFSIEIEQFKKTDSGKLCGQNFAEFFKEKKGAELSYTAA
jgi:hypothetical protein